MCDFKIRSQNSGLVQGHRNTKIGRAEGQRLIALKEKSTHLHFIRRRLPIELQLGQVSSFENVFKEVGDLAERVDRDDVGVAAQHSQQEGVVRYNAAAVVRLVAELERFRRLSRPICMRNERSCHRDEAPAVIQSRLLTPFHGVPLRAFIVPHAARTALLMYHFAGYEFEELRVMLLVWDFRGAEVVDVLGCADLLCECEDGVCVWKPALLEFDDENHSHAHTEDHFVPHHANEVVDFAPEEPAHLRGVQRLVFRVKGVVVGQLGRIGVHRDGHEQVGQA